MKNALELNVAPDYLGLNCIAFPTIWKSVTFKTTFLSPMVPCFGSSGKLKTIMSFRRAQSRLRITFIVPCFQPIHLSLTWILLSCYLAVPRITSDSSMNIHDWARVVRIHITLALGTEWQAQWIMKSSLGVSLNLQLKGSRCKWQLVDQFL